MNNMVIKKFILTMTLTNTSVDTDLTFPAAMFLFDNFKITKDNSDFGPLIKPETVYLNTIMKNKYSDEEDPEIYDGMKLSKDGSYESTFTIPFG